MMLSNWCKNPATEPETGEACGSRVSHGPLWTSISDPCRRQAKRMGISYVGEFDPDKLTAMKKKGYLGLSPLPVIVEMKI